MTDEELIARLRSGLIGVDVDKQAADRIEEYARAFTNLQREYGARGERIAELVEALRNIAAQKKTTELETEYDVECADFEGGYDAIIDVARTALAKIKEPQHG